MLHDASVAVRRVRSLQFHKYAVVGSIFLVAQQYDVALCVVVSGVWATMVGGLPWNARPRQELVVNGLAVANRG
jgi:hypothetical protein